MAERQITAARTAWPGAARLARHVTHAVFPPGCPICRAPTRADTGLCPECWPNIAFLDGIGCQWCSRPIQGALAGAFTDEPGLICDECQRTAPLWQRGTAVFRYEGAGRTLVLALKHGDRHDLVPVLGQWALRRAPALIAEADLIAPIPLHWRRRVKRRGNQAAELARWIASAAGKRQAFAPRLLVRTRNTGSQDGKNRDQRRTNLDSALALGPDARRRLNPSSRVLLVDDVMTTGATLNAAASVLQRAGISAIDVLVLALVMRDETTYMTGPDEDIATREPDEEHVT